MNAEENMLINMLANELSQAVFVLEPGNTIALANDYAKTVLGLAPGCNPELIREMFGQKDLYRFIDQASSEYQWLGTVPIYASQGPIGLFKMKTRHIFAPAGAPSNILIIGDLLLPETGGFPKLPARLEISHDQYCKLHEISKTINFDLDFRRICLDITMKAAELVGADRGLLLSGSVNWGNVQCTWNMSPGEVELFRVIDAKLGAIRDCAAKMAPILIADFNKHLARAPEIHAGLDRFESLLLFPLVVQQQLTGVLVLFGSKPAQFDDKELMLLHLISNQIGMAIHNARLYAEIQELNKHLTDEVHIKGTALRLSELQLLRKNRELEAIFDSITDMLIITDSQLFIHDINQAAQDYFSLYDKQAIKTKRFCEAICQQRYCKIGRGKGNNDEKIASHQSSSGRCSECIIVDTLLSGRPNVAEIDIADRVHLASVYPIFDEANKVAKVVCLLRDVTILKCKDGELYQAQKMSAVGQLAAGVAHEIRNPLGAIANHVYLLEEWLKKLEDRGVDIEEQARKSLQAIRKLMERSENVLRGLLDFSREKSNETAIFPLRDVVDQTLMLLGTTARNKKIDIVIDGDPNLKIMSNSSAIQHIIFNLALNSIDAMPDGGTLSISYRLENGDLVLKVIDNGEGIPKENIDKIYNPFYTTKGPNRGTGLGLYIVYNLVKQLNGKIEAASLPGVETVFSVTLPKAGIGANKHRGKSGEEHE